MVWQYISQQHQVVRAMCSGIGKTAVIYPVTALTGIATGTTSLGMIFFADECFRATPSQIGLLIAAQQCAYVLGCLIGRSALQWLLPRHSLFLACVVAAACLFLTLVTTSLTSLFVLFAIYGAAMSLFWPPIMGWLSSDLEGKRLNKAMGLFNICWSSGVIMSPLIAGRLGEIDPRLPIAISVGLHTLNAAIILGAIMALSRLNEDDHMYAQLRMTDPSGENIGCFLRFPAWVGLFTGFAATSAIVNIFALSGQFDLHMAKRTIGMIFLLRTASQTTALGLLGRTDFWHFSGRFILFVSLGFAAIILFLMSAESMPSLIISFAIMGLFVAQCYSNSMFHSMTGSVNRAARMAINESLIASGVIFGSSLGGTIYQRFDMSSVYLFCAFLLIITACVQATMIHLHEKTGRTS